MMLHFLFRAERDLVVVYLLLPYLHINYLISGKALAVKKNFCNYSSTGDFIFIIREQWIFCLTLKGIWMKNSFSDHCFRKCKMKLSKWGKVKSFWENISKGDLPKICCFLVISAPELQDTSFFQLGTQRLFFVYMYSSLSYMKTYWDFHCPFSLFNTFSKCHFGGWNALNLQSHFCTHTHQWSTVC